MEFIEVASKYSHLPATIAAERLHMSVTTLKKNMRMYNIPRWPSRAIRALDAAIVRFDSQANDIKIRHALVSTRNAFARFELDTVPPLIKKYLVKDRILRDKLRLLHSQS